MKKLLLIAILMLALVVTIVACDKKPANDDTTVADTTVETPTEEPTAAPTEEPTVTEEPTAAPTDPEEPTVTDEPTEKPEDPTEPPTEEQTTADPADPVWIMDAEGIAGIANVNNATITGGEGYASLTANAGDPWIQVCGNIGEMPEYLAIRYRTNTNQRGEIFTSNGANPEGGKSFVFDYNTNGEWNLLIFHLPTVAPYMTANTVGHIRYDFFLDVPAEGTFLDVAYIAFFNTAEYALAYDFEQYPPYIEADDAASGKKAYSFDTFYVNNKMYFEQDGGAGDKLTAQNNTLSFADASELQSIALRGWIGFDQPIASFGYYVDNYEFIFGEYTQATEDGVKAAGGEHASRFQINVDLSYLEGDDHFVGFVVKLEDGTIVRLRADIIIDLPELPKDITDSFKSDVNAYEVGTGMDASDMSNLFVIELPLGSEGVVANGDGKAYHLTGISDMYADVNGRYYIKANQLGGAGFLFVRGYKVVNSDAVIAAFDPNAGIYKINNYYETDSAGSYGGAGIYANVSNGTLIVNIKYYNPETVTRVGNKIFTIPCEGTDVTMADNGKTVSIMVGGKTLATIELVGSKVYEDINEVMPKNSFAEKAVVTLADGTTETIENTLIADTCECQVGIVARASNYMFDYLELGGYSAIVIPEMDLPETPDEPAGPVLNRFSDSYHANVDFINGGSDGGAGVPYQGLSASKLNSNGDAPVRKAADDGIVVNADNTVSISGWMAVKGGINHYAYTVNNGELINVVAGGADGEPLPDYYKNLGLADSTKNGLFNGTAALVADLSAYAGQTVTVSFYAIPETAQDTVAPIVTIEGLVVPAAEEPETPAEPVENYSVPQSQWVITGHRPALQDSSDGMVAAGGVESAALLHQGSIALGEIDLSKYSKVVIMWGCDNSQVTLDHYNANANNRIMLLNAEMTNVMSPAEGTIIAGGTYELKGWAVTAFEIDLTGIDYNGPVYVAIDTLPGTFALFASVEFIA